MARSERGRRTLNVAVALLGLVLTFPLWILIAIAIKATSRGPVFYSQLRVGLDTRRMPAVARDGDVRRKCDLGGRPFMMHKFRTMVVDAERATGPVWSSHGDSRVTRVGRFLRATRLDELPQFVDVIRGEMNVVGPRPERPQLFAELRNVVPGYAGRQCVRPGITGNAQVHFEADSTLEDVARKVKYDLEYIDRASIWLDLRIMALTLPVLVMRKMMLEPGRIATGPAATPVPGRAAQLAAVYVEHLKWPSPGAADHGARRIRRPLVTYPAMARQGARRTADREARA